MKTKFDEVKRKQKTKFKEIYSSSHIKNYDNGLLRDENSLNGSILILNASNKINVTELFKENKLLTIEVLNDIIEEILNKEIHFDFFIKLLLNIELKNGDLNNGEFEMYGKYESKLNMWKGNFKRSINKTMDFSRPMQLNTFLLMLDKVIKDYDSNRVSSEEAKNIYKEFSDYIGESLESFVRLYRNNDSLNPDVNYANILFNSKDIKLQEFPEIFKELRKYFLNEEKDIFSPNTKYGNSSLYGIDMFDEISIDELFIYLQKYPNINKIKIIDHQYGKNINNDSGYSDILRDLDEYAIDMLNYREYEKFKDRNIEISFLNSEINIFSLNKENVFVGALSKLSEKMQLNKNAIVNIENIYVPKKEIIYSHIKNEMDIVKENLFLSNLFDNGKTSEISVDIEKKPETEKVLNKYMWDNWNGQKFNIQGQKRKFIDFNLNVIPHSNMGYKEPSEWEYEQFKGGKRFFDPLLIELDQSVDYEVKRINIDRTKLNIIDMNIGSKTFIDLMSIIGKTHNDFLFSLDSKDMTQKNIIWYVFENIYKNNNKITFNNVDTINFLNIILQKFHKNFDFLNKKDFNGIDYYNFMNEIYKSEKIFKDIIELIVIKSYLGKPLININISKISANISEEKKKLNSNERKILEGVFSEIYQISMNDIILFQKNNSSINNYLKKIYNLSNERILDLKNRDGNKHINFENFSETPTDFIMNNEISILFNKNLSKLYKWYELNNELLYGITSNQINNYLLSILNGNEVDVDMLNYNNGKLKKYDNIEELQEQVKIILEDPKFKEYLKFGEAYILSKDDTYFLDVKKTQKEIITGKIENFPLEFEKMNLEQKQMTIQEIIRTDKIYNDDLTEEQIKVFNASPVSDFYTKVLNSFNYSDEDYEKVVEIITFFMENKDNKIEINGDKINDFVYYFNKIYEDVVELHSNGKLKLQEIQKSEDFILEMLYNYLKGNSIEFEKIYFKYYSEMTLLTDKIIIKKEDLPYLKKFEDEILTLLKDSNNVKEEIIEYIENSISMINRNLSGKKEKEFVFLDNDEFENNNSLIKPFLFYKIISDYINVQKRFKNEPIINTSVIMGQISEVINKEEYTKSLINIFKKVKPLFTTLSNKIKEKNLIDEGNSKMFVSEIKLNSIEKEIKISKKRIINKYNHIIKSVLNENFDRIEKFIEKSNITEGKTVFDLITSQLEVKFLEIKENKKFYNVSNKSFFVNISNDNDDIDKSIIMNALRNLAEKYKINILFGNYYSEKIDNKTAGHFIIKQENSIGITIKDSIIVSGSSVKDTIIVNNIQEEAQGILKVDNAVKIDKITFKEGSSNNNFDKISYFNYQNQKPLNIMEIGKIENKTSLIKPETSKTIIDNKTNR